jgi:predicted GH43/DUF377 family glycosyl hydrolase
MKRDHLMKSSTTSMQVRRATLRLEADPRRVLARPFVQGEATRTKKTIRRVLSLKESVAAVELRRVIEGFGSRHKGIERILESHCGVVAGEIPCDARVSSDRRLLIGAYFTLEYSLESVALFNPSMVPHPDQSGLGADELRFVMSLRACGEGHISSIAFRSGVIDADSEITLDAITPYAMSGKVVDNKVYEKHPFFLKLIEMGAYDECAQSVLDRLQETFTLSVLQGAIDRLREKNGSNPHFEETVEKMLWLAHSNYSLSFPDDADLSERVIFPIMESESRGIEDARFVRFVEDDGQANYYATYTAYNGFTILPQIIETDDFTGFKIITLNGRCVQNKGMALFPRRVAGQYNMLARLDGEHLYLMNSENLHFWNEAKRLKWKRQPWEYVQVGNCGSPIETEAGWLVLTHGVGPMREYCIGAILLDLKKPSKVIGSLSEPLIVPAGDERDGYVPNVVYSCGGLVHRGNLIIPYAVADTWSSVAVLSLPELIGRLKGRRAV